MKTASAALQTFLANASENPADMNVFVTDLYTFTLVNGATINWCTGDRPISLKQGPIASYAIANGGNGYAIGDTGNILGVTFDATYTVTGVSGGVVSSISILPGSKYQVWNGVNTIAGGSQPGSGSGLQLNITAVSGTVNFNPLSPANNAAPAIKRTRVNSTVGFSVDDLIIEVYASPNVIVNSTQLQNALTRGDFDGAAVFVQRLISPTYGDTTMGTITLFSGTVGDVQDVGKIYSKITVKALTELLSIDLPRNLYQPGCGNTLFDVDCTLNRASFVTFGTVSPGASVIVIPTSLTQPGGIAPPASAPTLSTTSLSGINLTPTTYYVVVTYLSALGETVASAESSLAVTANRLLVVHSPASVTGATGYNVYVGYTPGGEQLQNGSPISIGTNWTEAANGLSQGAPPPIAATNGYFSQGVITFTSGANTGISRIVIGYDSSGVVTLLVSLPVAPSSGDSFTIVPGCDKQMSTCQQKFSNLINFKGTPFIPQPEAVI